MNNMEAVAIFTLDQLWLLRSVVRHEMAQQETWKIPPADRSLNGQIASAILFCVDNAQGEAAVRLTLGDTYVLDYCVQQDAKDPKSGVNIGKPILLEVFRARKAIEEGENAYAEEPPAPSKAEIAERLKEMPECPPPRKRRSRRQQ